MDAERQLPKFHRPPLIEVVHGVQFRRLPMTIVHPGLFFLRVQRRYPKSQTVPPLPRVIEDLDPSHIVPPVMMVFPRPDDLPRAWFISDDDAMLLQLQADKLLLNWRHRSDEATYPHFEAVAEEFGRAYEELEEFSKEHGLGTIEPDQAEMTYVNHLVKYDARGSSPPPENILRVWSGGLGSEWDLPLEDLSFNIRYPLRNGAGESCGRLSATLTTQVIPRESRRVLQLELTARGTPAAGGRDAVAAFHSIAHQRIVMCFTALTTEVAHKMWDRYQ